MASTNKTANYNLSQWVRTDAPEMADFNADNTAVDTALHTLNTALSGKASTASVALKAEVVMGTYEGNDTASRSITLGFRPKAVLVSRLVGATCAAPGNIFSCGGLALDGYPCTYPNNAYVASGTITATGFTVSHDSSRSGSAVREPTPAAGATTIWR